MAARFDRLWRLCATAVSFAVFGVGGLAIGAIVFPIIHVVSAGRETAYRRCQYIVHLAFRLFIWMMRGLGVLTYEVRGVEKLGDGENRIVVANHPSLLDVVFIIALLPRTLCVVKKKAWSNPVMTCVLSATSYIPNDDPRRLIDICVERLRQGNTLVIFPEGTRTVPGRPLALKRGAASIIIRSGKTVNPIAVTCTPNTLTKGERWYQVPKMRPNFRIAVGDSVEPGSWTTEELPFATARRHVNRALHGILLRGIANIEQAR